MTGRLPLIAVVLASVRLHFNPLPLSNTGVHDTCTYQTYLIEKPWLTEAKGPVRVQRRHSQGWVQFNPQIQQL